MSGERKYNGTIISSGKLLEKINVGDTLSVHYWKNPRGVMWLKKWYLKTAGKPSGRNENGKETIRIQVRQIGTVVMFIAAGVFRDTCIFQQETLDQIFQIK